MKIYRKINLAVVTSITAAISTSLLLSGCQTAATLTSHISGRPLPRKVAQQMYDKDPSYYGRYYAPSGQAWHRIKIEDAYQAPQSYRQKQGTPKAQPNNVYPTTRSQRSNAPQTSAMDTQKFHNKFPKNNLQFRKTQSGTQSGISTASADLDQQPRSPAMRKAMAPHINRSWIHPRDMAYGNLNQKERQRFLEQTALVSRDLGAAVAYSDFLKATQTNRSRTLNQNSTQNAKRTRSYIDPYPSNRPNSPAIQTSKNSYENNVVKTSGYNALGY